MSEITEGARVAVNTIEADEAPGTVTRLYHMGEMAMATVAMDEPCGPGGDWDELDVPVDSLRLL